MAKVQYGIQVTFKVYNLNNEQVYEMDEEGYSKIKYLQTLSRLGIIDLTKAHYTGGHNFIVELE